MHGNLPVTLFVVTRRCQLLRQKLCSTMDNDYVIKQGHMCCFILYRIWSTVLRTHG